MEYRLLGGSGLKVPALSFGTGTFGGGNEFFKAWGSTRVAEAKRLIDICLEAGVNLFDTADIYSDGRSEEVLGKALKGKRDKALISTKTTGFPTGPGPTMWAPRATICGRRSRAACAPRHRLCRHLPSARL
jgi:aryl-alcohol dehydrogenase-like predicted oxidoreductase